VFDKEGEVLVVELGRPQRCVDGLTSGIGSQPVRNYAGGFTVVEKLSPDSSYGVRLRFHCCLTGDLLHFSSLDCCRRRPFDPGCRF
jgi:hypothetical protein